MDNTLTTRQAPPAYIIDVSDLGAGLKSVNGPTGAPQPHVLGPERGNPFTVAALDAAETTVRGYLSGGGHHATDHYIKFSPQDHDDLYELEEADFFLTDYPWTRELLTRGDYYQTTGSPDDFPDLYTTIAVGTTLPDVPHTILAVLDLSETDPVIIKQSFEDTGNGAAYVEEFEKDGAPSSHDFSNTQRDPTGDGTDDTDCELGPDCDGQGGGNGGGGLLVNECGCLISPNPRRPGGTVKVEDTQYQTYVPVRRVRIVGKNNWFTWHEADTDDRGCWRINHTYQGRTWFWVKFKDGRSDRGRFRFAGVIAEDFWKKSFTGKIYLGRMAGNDVHNIIARFPERGVNQLGGQIHKAWAGATASNALHNYHDFAERDGFLGLPKLNIMVMMGRSDGFAPMMRQMGVGNMMNAVSDGVAASISEEDLLQSALGVQFNYISGVTITTSPLNQSIIRTFFGDVNVGADYRDSDAMKRLVYHELGHASHFEGTSVSYWKNVIRATVAAGGHGDPDSFLAGHLQVAESWAEHIALTMVKQEYPIGLVVDPNGNSVTGNDWALAHEEIRNESLNHIPIGIYKDLIDPNNTEIVRDENMTNANFVLIDGVNGYSNLFFSNQLNSTVTTPEILLDRCLSDLPSGVTDSDVTSLFSQY